MSTVIEPGGAKNMIKMLRIMLNFRKDNLKESEQVTQSSPKIKMGESKSRKENCGRKRNNSETVPWCGLNPIAELKKASWEKQLN